MTFRFPTLSLSLLLLCACSVLLTMTCLRGEDSFVAPRITADQERKEARPSVKPADEEWKTQIKAGLKRQVTFEFVDAPFGDAIAFVQQIGGASIVIQPSVPVNRDLTLKVKDIPIEEALTLICNLNGAEWKLQNRAIVIDLTEAALAEKRAAAAQEKESAERARAQQIAAASSGRLRVKFANGTEVEAEGSALHDLTLLGDLQTALFDPAEDGLLCVSIPSAYATSQLDEIRRVCAEIAPKAKLDYNPSLQVLLATGDDARDLRRVATLLRQLKFNAAKPDVQPALPMPKQ